MIDEPIGRDTELVSLVRLQFRGLPEAQRKAFWVRNVTRSTGRRFDASVALGSLGSSRAVYAAALGVASEDSAAPWAKAYGAMVARRGECAETNPVSEMPVRHAFSSNRLFSKGRPK